MMSEDEPLYEQCLAKLEEMLVQEGNIVKIPTFTHAEIVALLKYVAFLDGFKTAVWELGEVVRRNDYD